MAVKYIRLQRSCICCNLVPDWDKQNNTFFALRYYCIQVGYNIDLLSALDFMKEFTSATKWLVNKY